jgi:hypothetical protein
MHQKSESHGGTSSLLPGCDRPAAAAVAARQEAHGSPIGRGEDCWAKRNIFVGSVRRSVLCVEESVNARCQRYEHTGVGLLQCDCRASLYFVLYRWRITTSMWLAGFLVI